MKKQFFFWCFLAFLSIDLPAQQVDLNESKISFEVSNLGVRTVEGTITGMTGTVKFDPNDLLNSSFKVFLEISTINTDNDSRDKHLKNEDFFEVSTYPTMSFISTRIMKEGDAYKVKGYLKIKDVTKEIEIPFQVTKTNGKRALKGNLTILRKEYHVGVSTGNFMVGNEIEVEILCVIR